MVATRLRSAGVEIRMQTKVTRIVRDGNRISSVTVRDQVTGAEQTIAVDYVLSSMAIRDLIVGMDPPPPADARRVGEGLEYRDFMTVGLLLKKLRKTAGMVEGSSVNLVPDNWIYIQDRGVSVGRIQVFNNWSPYMVADPDTVWVGMEYFCLEGDQLWSTSDAALGVLAAKELGQIGLVAPEDVLDSVVIRQPKAYPGYYGTYNEFDVLKKFTDTLENLFLIGRNGMHRYNNQDHSMLTAKLAAEAIIAGSSSKAPLWDVNVEEDYHEEKAEAAE